KCKTCHNPTGQASDEPVGGLHYTGSTDPIGCGKCHEPHNIDPNSGWTGDGLGGEGLIRQYVRRPDGSTGQIIFAPGVFVQPGGNGICQTCHTKTQFYTNDGANQTHEAGFNCVSCHSHELGFGGGATTSAHFDANADAWGTDPSSQACLRCHTDGGFKDYIGFNDAKPNYLDSSFQTNSTSYPAGPLNCTSCHNSVSDPDNTPSAGLHSVLFVSLVRVNGLDNATALCSQCHQGRESTPSVESKIALNVAIASRGLGIASITATGAGTTSTIIRSGMTAGQYIGYTILATNNDGNQGQVRTVTNNDSTTITLSDGALPLPTATGNTFTAWPAATGGDGDTYANKGVTIPNVTRGIDLVDANRAWTANQWTNFYLYMETGSNAGLYRLITGNTANTLSVANAGLTTGTPFPFVIAAGDRYLILPPESTAVLDTVASGISFSNPHYGSAAATMMGDLTHIGVQVPANWGYGTQDFSGANVGPSGYAGRNFHGVSQESCTSCHNPHTLEVVVNSATCGRCHFNEDGTPVNSMGEIEEARQFGFGGDLDGNNAETSLKSEIDGMAANLLTAIKSYAVLKGGGAICYDAVGTGGQYYFKDNGLGGGIAGDGICQPGEIVSTNAYGTAPGWFTPRLLRSSYEYQYYVKEPAAWAHNPRYIIELLYDATRELNVALPSNKTAAAGGQVGYICLSSTDTSASTRSGALLTSPDVPASVAAMNSDGTCPAGFTKYFGELRSFKEGHFGGMTGGLRNTPFYAANQAGEVRYPCTRCHSGQKGFELYLAQPTFLDETNASYAVPEPGVQGMECTTCHTPLATDTDMKRLRDMTATPIKDAGGFGGVRFPGHLASGTLLPAAQYTTVLNQSYFGDKNDMICASCHDGRDMGGKLFDAYLAGTWSGFDIPGSAFYGSATITLDGGGNILVSGLPVYQPAIPKGTPNNWLYTTSCQAVGKFITIAGSTVPAYNGTWAISSCGNGTASLPVAYTANATGYWAAWVAGTKNTHDIGVANRVYGADAHIGYEYAGKTYTHTKVHHGAAASCVECHSPKGSRHSMEVADAVAAGTCASCHPGTSYTTWSAASRGLTTGPGYDGDVTTQTLPDELVSFRRGLAQAMNAYARANGVTQSGGNLCWSDANSAFRLEVGNTTGWCTTATTSWTNLDPALARAGYNLIFASVSSDPGAWAHNFSYVAQLLYDSAQDLSGGAPVTYVNGGTFTLTRP
ncbi:MAG TPA: hypothetical protein VLW85_09920, partial [Myxococcales bacterium]|nr:hypothetical protein [Myxococcales bacterium]